VTIAQQIARTVLGVDEVILEPADTLIGSAGSTSASRQTWMSGGAVMAACEAIRTQIVGMAAERWDTAQAGVELRENMVRTLNGEFEVPLVEFIGSDVLHQVVEYRHRETFPLDENGQGNAHVSWAFSAHRAVVDVDAELGLVRVIEMATTQDTGTILNPLHVLGQIEGGTAQGVGLAVMEEIVLDNGKVRNPSFTDYLIPTALDMPVVRVAGLYDQPEPGAPFGAKGVGEPPTISSTPAVAAAIRNATGLELPRVPIRPQDIVFAKQ
jgi:CO/xanthine dehydrogenase Mo-binding subunit